MFSPNVLGIPHRYVQGASILGTVTWIGTNIDQAKIPEYILVNEIKTSVMC